MKKVQTKFIHRPVRTGAMTLMITTVLICLAVLAVLALATARADVVMADKALAGLQEQARIEITGQEYLAQLDAALKTNGMLPAQATRQQDGTIQAVLSVNNSTLEIVVQPKEVQPEDPAAYQILTWHVSTGWQPDQSLDLWNGM